MATLPRMTVRLDWDGDQRFKGAVGSTAVVVDGKAAIAPSPVQMLSAGLAACMAIDVVHILGKMRTPASALSVELDVERAATDPRRIVNAAMKFLIVGDVPQKNVQRALDMSKETYCSVWHSLREDIPLHASFEIRDR